MTISDVVMAYTDMSANSEGGFSSIYGEDKVGDVPPNPPQPRFGGYKSLRYPKGCLATAGALAACAGCVQRALCV